MGGAEGGAGSSSPSRSINSQGLRSDDELEEPFLPPEFAREAEQYLIPGHPIAGVVHGVSSASSSSFPIPAGAVGARTSGGFIAGGFGSQPQVTPASPSSLAAASASSAGSSSSSVIDVSNSSGGQSADPPPADNVGEEEHVGEGFSA